MPIDEQSDFEEALELAACIRAHMAISKVRKKAAEKDLDKLASRNIDKEIETVHKQRKR